MLLKKLKTVFFAFSLLAASTVLMSQTEEPPQGNGYRLWGEYNCQIYCPKQNYYLTGLQTDCFWSGYQPDNCTPVPCAVPDWDDWYFKQLCSF